MSKRYIDAEALIKKLYPLGMGDGNYGINAKAVRKAIDSIPSERVVSRLEYDGLEIAFINAKDNLGDTKAELNKAEAEIERLKAEILEYKLVVKAFEKGR